MVEGGGIWLATEEGPLSMTRTTIANNVARHQATTGGVAEGGGIWMVGAKSGSVTLLSTTIAANRLEAAAGPSTKAETSSGPKKSLSATRSSPTAPARRGSENCSAPEPPRTPLAGVQPGQPRPVRLQSAGRQGQRKTRCSAPLQLNGGQTLTMMPRRRRGPRSTRAISSGLASDQRGVVRPIDLPSIPNTPRRAPTAADIGAVEFQPSNALRLGKLNKNKKKGTATLSVILPAPPPAP